MRAYIEPFEDKSGELVVEIPEIAYKEIIEVNDFKWSYFQYNEDGDLITNFANSHDDESKANRILSEVLREDEI